MWNSGTLSKQWKLFWRWRTEPTRAPVPSVDGHGAHKYSCCPNYSWHHPASCSKQKAIKIIPVWLSLGVALGGVCALQPWQARDKARHNRQEQETPLYEALYKQHLRNVRASKYHDIPTPVCRFGTNCSLLDRDFQTCCVAAVMIRCQGCTHERISVVCRLIVSASVDSQHCAYIRVRKTGWLLGPADSVRQNAYTSRACTTPLSKNILHTKNAQIPVALTVTPNIFVGPQ